MMHSDLSKFNNGWYKPGAKLKILIWFFCNAFFLQNKYNPFSKVKVMVLRIFGAKIGTGVVLKQSISVKYPWKLTIGNYSWIMRNTSHL